MLQPEMEHTQQKKIYKCYVCKQPNINPHVHYHKLCQDCGEFNEQKRLAKHDLQDYIALVTGGRTKIGYHTALRLLRDGARVIVTSRFPYDTLQRYIREPDFDRWKDRIHLYGLDFRRLDHVEKFASFLDKQFPYLDIIINNAAQTVRMSDEEYQTLALQEQELQHKLSGTPISLLPSGLPSNPDQVDQPNPISTLSQLSIYQENPMVTSYPPKHNAWMAKSDQISVMEMLEVQLINVTAPFLINTKCKPAMLRSPNRNRFVVNVSSVEGMFDKKRKGRYHVHTNMAKASLNMMTLTMSKEYKKDRIFITSVDPGWVSNQFPEKAPNKPTIHLPLDFEDAAARICDPIYEGKDAEKPVTGVFLKDYREVDW